jgi:hypothetical protein
MNAVEPLTTQNQDVAASAGGELRVRIVRDYPGIEEIRPIWTAWQNHPNADIDFYLMVVRSRPETLHPFVLVLYRGDTPVAMLIGRMDQSLLEFKVGYKTFHKAPVRQLTFINGGWLGSLSLPDCEFLAREIMNSLKRERVDVVFLNHVRTGSALYQAVTHLPGFLTREHFQTPVIHRSMILPPTVEELYRGLSPKVRKNLKWQAKKLMNDFPGVVDVQTFRSVGDLDRMIQDVEQVAKKTYQRGLGAGFVDGPEMRKRLCLEAERGWLRAHILYIAGVPAAFWIGNSYGNTFHSNYMGYDAVYSKYSVGMFLIMRTIENMIGQSGASMPAQIDFGLGDAQYKDVLGTCHWEEASPHLFATSPKGICLNALWTSTMLVDGVARRLLGKAGIIQKTKKTWRGRLRRNPGPPPETH